MRQKNVLENDVNGIVQNVGFHDNYSVKPRERSSRIPLLYK